MGFGVALLAREDWTHDIEVSSLFSILLLMIDVGGFSCTTVELITDMVGTGGLPGLHGFAALATTVTSISWNEASDC